MAHGLWHPHQTLANQGPHPRFVLEANRWCKTRVPRLDSPNTHHIGLLFVKFIGTWLNLEVNTYYWFEKGSYKSYFRVSKFFMNSDRWSSYSPKFDLHGHCIWRKQISYLSKLQAFNFISNLKGFEAVSDKIFLDFSKNYYFYYFQKTKNTTLEGTSGSCLTYYC